MFGEETVDPVRVSAHGLHVLEMLGLVERLFEMLTHQVDVVWSAKSQRLAKMEDTKECEVRRSCDLLQDPKALVVSALVEPIND